MLWSRGLVGYWPLENSALDASGNGHDATLFGPAYTAGNQGQGISLDGIDDYALISSDGFGVFNLQSFTIAARIKTPAAYGPDFPIWSYDYTSHSHPYYCQHLRIKGDIRNGSVLFGFNIGGAFQFIDTGIFELPLNAWSRIVATFTSGKQEIWTEGVLRASSSHVGVIIFQHQPVWIGRANFAFSCDCCLDELAVWNRALSVSDIRRVMMGLQPIS
jgi:hypothetical protein